MVRGGAVQTKLPKPETRHNFYRDIAVVAFPVSQKELDAANNPLKITCSQGEREARKLFDGNLLNGTRIALSKRRETGWIQFEYKKPFPAQSVRIETSSRNGDCKLYASQDGKKFELVTEPTDPVLTDGGSGAAGVVKEIWGPYAVPLALVP